MTTTRHALIIANDRYDDQGLKKLRAPAQDAAALAGVLRDPEIGDFEVDVMENKSVQDLRRCIQTFFNKRRRDDTLLVHFSCHGIKSESGELYFAARDTDHELLDATALPSHFVRRCMSDTRAGRTVLFLDCCYAGAFSRGSSTRASGKVHVLESFAGDKPPGGRGRAVITASNSMEYAFEGPDLADSAPQPSVFTHAVVRGLETGEADRDGDGEVSLDELYDYVFDRVRDANPNQTPQKNVEMEGDLHLAHSRRGRIKIVKADSPDALLAGIHSDNVITRQGAVLELRSRLQDDYLPVAEGARQDLEEIARADIHQVAEQARSALREIRVTPSPDRLDFGRVTRGSVSPRESVALGGPPLARHCVAQSTQSWLRVEPVPNGLNVSVDTTNEGHLSGDIVLKGVADDAQVHVEAVVTPASPTVCPDPPERPPETGPETGPDTAVIDPQSSVTRTQETVTTRRPPSPPPRPHRAPALAGVALALAVTAVVTVVLVVRKAADAVDMRLDDGRSGQIEWYVHDLGALVPLTIALIAAPVALVLSALARHDLDGRPDRYPKSASHSTRSVLSWAKGLAVPSLVLAVLVWMTYLVGSAHW